MNDEKLPSRDDIKKMFEELIVKYSLDGSAKISDETELSELGIESIDIIDIVFQIEDTYDLELDISNDQQFEKFGELVDALFNKLHADIKA